MQNSRNIVISIGAQSEQQWVPFKEVCELLSDFE